MKKRAFKLGSSLSALALLLIFGFSVSGHAASTGGGGKISPANPVIVFRYGNDIFVADRDGGNQTVVYRNVYAGNSAAWCSPDGSDIIFQHQLNGQPGVYRLPIIDISSGKRTVRVGAPQLVAKTPFLNAFVSARCSPVLIDGEIKVVYDAQPADGAGNALPYTNLYLADVGVTEDGSPTLLLSGNATQPSLVLSSPSWSPLGDRIAFSSTPWGVDGQSDVKVMQISGSANPLSLILALGQVSPLSSSPQDGADFFWPRWSNRSNRDLIAVDAGPSHSELNSGRELWLIPVDGPTSAYSLAYDKVEGVGRFQPSWSPDDSQLIYVRNPRKGMCGDKGSATGGVIGLSNVNGGATIEPINKNGTLCDEIPLISKDGRFPDWWRGAP